MDASMYSRIAENIGRWYLSRYLNELFSRNHAQLRSFSHSAPLTVYLWHHPISSPRGSQRARQEEFAPCKINGTVHTVHAICMVAIKVPEYGRHGLRVAGTAHWFATIIMRQGSHRVVTQRLFFQPGVKSLAHSTIISAEVAEQFGVSQQFDKPVDGRGCGVALQDSESFV